MNILKRESFVIIFKPKTLMSCMWEIGGSDSGKLKRGFFQRCRERQGGDKDAYLHSPGIFRAWQMQMSIHSQGPVTNTCQGICY